tara:strand:+ start:820 stop:1572 length:753 start_codon:yes stop_codon:yes gene_type:complete
MSDNTTTPNVVQAWTAEIEGPQDFHEPPPVFDPIDVGQTIMVFQTPPEMVERMNDIYDELMPTGQLPKVSDDKQLHDEYSVYFDDDNDFTTNHNFIPEDIHRWIKDRIHQYLQVKQVSYSGIKTHVSWINDYGDSDFIPNHMHYGKLTNSLQEKTRHSVGLIGMLVLKVPTNMGGDRYDDDCAEFNKCGVLEFTTGNHPQLQFAMDTVAILVKTGTFVVFPYDMYHCVYPHFNKNETRRTMPTNIDVFEV